MTAARQLTLDELLAQREEPAPASEVNSEPPRSPHRPKIDGLHNVFVAPPEGAPQPTGPLPIPARSAHDAEQTAAAIADVDPERCLALPAREGDWAEELVAFLDESNRRAEDDLQRLRHMHARIVGCSVDELDARLAAEKAFV